jgi:hypothetical protein
MRQSGRALFLVPIVYVAVILGLLFLQFSGGERFTRSVGPLTLRATRGGTAEDGSTIITSVDLSFEGMTFAFQEDQGLIVERRSDVTDELVTGFEVLDTGFAIQFEEGYVLSFLAGLEPRELRIVLTNDTPGEDAREYSIPFALDILPADRGEAMSFATLTREDGEYYLTAPPDAVIDLANEKFVLAPSALGQTIRYVEATEGDPGRIAELFQDESLTITDREYEALVGGYVDAAYEGWRGSRYRSAGLAWEQGEGAVAFAEDTLTAYLAEAWDRNEYERAYGEMRRATDLHPGDLTLLSSPFLGNLREIREETLAADALRAAELRDRVATSDLTIYRQPDLFRFAADRGGASLYDELLTFTDAVELRALDVQSAIGLLANLYLDPPQDSRAADLALRAVDLIQASVLGAIVDTPDGFFIQSAPGQLDMRLTVTAGVTLTTYGASRGDQLITRIGRNLVASVLEQSNASGLVPASLLLRGDVAEDGGGTLRPEEIYPILADNNAYPHQVTISTELGPGHWIFTVAGVRTIGLNDESWEFEFTYPRLRTHYILMQGIPNFERMELFGQTWRNAPDFEIYSKGRHYNEESETLMIKYYDNSVTRPVRIFF